jgi:glucose-6-phosphate 1-epimerase
VSPSPDPCARVTATAADGAQLVICAHGGQLLAWTPASGGPSRLWLSPLARCGPGQAIRGGIPVIFPQFSDRGPLPKHGVVRDRAWTLEPTTDGASARLVARIRDDEGTLSGWPQAFELTLTIEASGDQLEVSLDVVNTGAIAWSFTAALHTYLTTSDAAQATVEGLAGLDGEDNAAGRAAVRLPAGPLTALGPRDVAVRDAGGAVVLIDPVLGRLLVEADGFTDRVLWNPGPDHGLGDVPAGGAASFVCVEPAVLNPVALSPGGRWQGVLRLRAEPSGPPPEQPAG